MAFALPAVHRQKGWNRIILLVLATLLAPIGWAGHSNPNHSGDFDGDGCMDPTIYNESSAEWQTLMYSYHFDPHSFFLGGPGWSAIMADYDGDGKADATVYNRTTGEWVAMLSSLGTNTVTITFGGEGWNVVTGDFDGDGIDDPAIYREADGQWEAILSRWGNALANFVFGGPGYLSVSGDYDGDGLSDPALYRKDDGLWRVALSSLNYTEAAGYVYSYGDSPLVPAPFDYDGDGKTDPAVFAYGCGASIGKQYVFGYYVLSSSQNYAQNDPPFRQLGREDARDSNVDPLPGDFDGDGKGDYGASWPDNPGAWRMWCSTHNWGRPVWDRHDDAQWNGDGTGFHPVQR